MSEQTENPQLTLEDLNYFWTPNGAPCFIANNYDKIDDICQVIESFGFQIYYLITDKMTRKTQNIKNEKGVSVPTEFFEYTPAVLKVVNNYVGRAVMDSDDPLGNDFCPVEEVAEYNMPPIPRIIVDKLDEFFRLVDAQHGTESIVILTYDTTKEGSEGWGVLVPEQTNTSVHCNYNADSIAELKPDHVLIVGSVHSHPNMSAYASGTDHADQADFDGIHITYGWQKTVNNGATQYHIEMQISGSNYQLKPEDVFEGFAPKNADPEVVEWASKVKKVTPPTTGGYTTPYITSANNQTPYLEKPLSSQLTQVGMTLANDSYKDNGKYFREKFVSELSAVESDAIVGVEYDNVNDITDCLVCTFPVDKEDIERGSCSTCDSPIVSSLFTRDQIVQLFNRYCISRNIPNSVAYYLYCLDSSVPNHSFLINIKPEGEIPENYTDYDMYKDDEVSREKLVCCGKNVIDVDLCVCTHTITNKDAYLFDNAHSQIDIYEKDGGCFKCDHYYLNSCPTYKNAIVDFTVNGTMLPAGSIFICDSFIPFNKETYAYESDSYYG